MWRSVESEDLRSVEICGEWRSEDRSMRSVERSVECGDLWSVSVEI